MMLLNSKHVALWVSLFATTVHSAEFSLVNIDSAGEGLNDNTPVAIIGGNNEVTLGNQRKAVIQYAFDYLGSLIQADIIINVSVSFDSLYCDKEMAILGGGSPTSTAYNFSEAPQWNVQYPAALANFYAGRDLDPTQPEIELVLSSSIENNPDCLEHIKIYNGLDAPSNESQVSLLSTVIHEIVHGLGVLTYMDANGELDLANGSSLSDPYLELVYDTEFNNFFSKMGAYTRLESLLYRKLGLFSQTLSEHSQYLTEGTLHLGNEINGEKVLSPKIFNPEIYNPGSSISHLDSSLLPQPLMSPYSNDNASLLLSEVDKALLASIGWPVLLPISDRDGDGYSDSIDGYPDDPLKTISDIVDADNDKLPDDWERQHGLVVDTTDFLMQTFRDFDRDGLTTLQELNLGLDPNSRDTDGDKIADGLEVSLGFDPTDINSCPLASCLQDTQSKPTGKIELNRLVSEDLSEKYSRKGATLVGVTSSKSGDTYLSLRNYDNLISKFDVNGNFDQSFGKGGTLNLNGFDVNETFTIAGKILEDSQGNIFIPVLFNFQGDIGFEDDGTFKIQQRLTFLKATKNGDINFHYKRPVVNIVGGAILGNIDRYISYTMDIDDNIVIAISDLSSEMHSRSKIILQKFLPSGDNDSSFGIDGKVFIYSNFSHRTGTQVISDTIGNYYVSYLEFNNSVSVGLYKIDSRGILDSEVSDRITNSISTINGRHQLSTNENILEIFESKYANSVTRYSYWTFDSTGAGERLDVPITLNEATCKAAKTSWFCISSPRGFSDDYKTGIYYIQSFDKLTSTVSTVYESYIPDTTNSVINNFYFSPLENGFLVVGRPNGGSQSISLRKFESGVGFDTNEIFPIIKTTSESSFLSIKSDDGSFLLAGAKSVKDEDTINIVAKFFKSGKKDRSFGINGEVEIPNSLSSFGGADNPEIIVKGVPYNNGYLLITSSNYSSSLFYIDRLGLSVNLLAREDSTDPVSHVTISEILPLNDNDVAVFTIKKSDTGSHSDVYVINEGGLKIESPLNNLILSSIGDDSIVQSARSTENELELLVQRRHNFDVWSSLYRYRIVSETLEFISKVDFPINQIVENYANHEQRDQTLYWGRQCFIAYRCEDTSFEWMSLLNKDGTPVSEFNSGRPLYEFLGRLAGSEFDQKVSFRNVFFKDDHFDIQGTANLGLFWSDYNSEFGGSVEGGNAFYFNKVDYTGTLLYSKPVIIPTGHNEIYTSCSEVHSGSGTCNIMLSGRKNFEVLSWTDLDELALFIEDGDADGLPDGYEISQGFDPFDSTDALLDFDTDGISNLGEYLNGTNPKIDDYGPELTIPDNLELLATGNITKVSLGTAQAVDAVSVNVDVVSSSDGYFLPGLHEILWQASDQYGNTTKAIQKLSLHPLASAKQSAHVKAGEEFEFEINLNGIPPNFPVWVKTKDVVTGIGDEAYRGFDYHTYDATAHFNDLFTSQIRGKARTSNDPNLSKRFTLAIDTSDGMVGNYGLAPSHSTLFELTNSPVNLPFKLVVQQGEVDTTTVAFNGANVSVFLTQAGQSINELDWSTTSTELLEIAQLADDRLVFNPQSLVPGNYRISVSLINDGAIETISQLLQVLDIDTSLGNQNVTLEPALDADFDGIPNIRDSLSSTYVLDAVPAYFESVNVIPGYQIAIGDEAANVHSLDGRLSLDQLSDDLQVLKDFNKRISNVLQTSEVFNVRISEMDTRGKKAAVVIPLKSPLQDASSAYYFNSDAMNWDSELGTGISVSSAARVDGICPLPLSESYVGGVTTGFTCMQLEVEDGGPYDLDSSSNGKVEVLVAPSTNIKAPDLKFSMLPSDLSLNYNRESPKSVFNFKIDSSLDLATITGMDLHISLSISSGKRVALYLDSNHSGLLDSDDEMIHEFSDGELNSAVHILFNGPVKLRNGENRMFVGVQQL